MGDLKVEGKVSEWCSKCKHCIAYDTIVTNGIYKITTYNCEDPYDGLIRELDAEDDICCSMFEPTHEKTEGRYPWGSDEDKVLKYCANDVVIIAEQMAREKQKELEDKVEKYEKILCDIYSILHPYSAENKNISAEMAFIKLPDEVEAKAKACKDNFDECIRQMRIIDELKTENARLKETTAGNYKASIRKDDLIRSLRNENKTRDDEIMRLQWRNDNQCKMIQDLKKERDEIDDKYGKLKFKFCDMLQEKGELEETNNRYYKDNERLAKKNRELQIRVNDLIFQHQEDTKKIIELKDDKYRILKENICNRYGYPAYAAMKAEDKIEHIQKEAKRWKNKYKEAYDILQELFGPGLINMEYEASYDDLILHLTYEAPAHGDKGVKCNKLREAYERMKKLD